MRFLTVNGKIRYTLDWHKKLLLPVINIKLISILLSYRYYTLGARIEPWVKCSKIFECYTLTMGNFEVQKRKNKKNVAFLGFFFNVYLTKVFFN